MTAHRVPRRAAPAARLALRFRRRPLPFLACVAFALCLSSARATAERSPSLHDVEEHLSALQLQEAAAALQAIERRDGQTPALLVQQGMLRFYQGRYEEALQVVEQALANEDDRGERIQFEEVRSLLASTLRATRRLERAQSADGRYEVYYMPGKDSVLSRYALQVMEAADRAINRRLGSKVPGPIRLEIYPSADALSLVSALTVEQIETTGTIALSKWNRLMVTTPRALVRGYPWADTITHELVHMVVSHMTGDQAPVWLQEGTAKMLERSWRRPGDNRMRLDPAAKALLGQAKHDGTLLTFDEMHPSIAMLPSQDAAALAFAEVATFMERYVDRYGDEALRSAFARINAGDDARDALASAAGIGFRQLESGWKTTLPALPDDSGPRHLELRLRRGAEQTDDTLDVAQIAARRYLRLGDLLWDRGRVGAATAEYEKASHEAPDDPIVGSRLARAALSSGQPDRALQAVERLSLRYPEHAPTQAMLGAARLATGDRAAAAEALREALYINPFDPQPHCDLAKATDQDTEKDLELATCETLRQSP